MKFSDLSSDDRHTIGYLVDALHEAIDANDTEFSFAEWSVNAMCRLGIMVGVNRSIILKSKSLDIDLSDNIDFSN